MRVYKQNQHMNLLSVTYRIQHTMDKIVLLLATCLTVTALPQQSRIAGGETVSAAQYPFAAAIFSAHDSVTFKLVCGGTILNSRSVMSATSCFIGAIPNQLRIRVGSVSANSGGSVHNVARTLAATPYDDWNRNNNIGILRVVTLFQFGINVAPAQLLAFANFDIGDNQPVTTIGWGKTAVGGDFVNQLRRVEVRTVNQGTCQNVYGVNFINVNMMCAGWQFNQNTTRGACDGDIGSPLLHNVTVIGITSYTYGCGDVNYPTVYTRVNRFTNWITNNA